MALIDSKQLNPRFTGSFTLSGSRQTFIGPTTFTGSIIASGNISGSLTSTGSFGRLDVAGDTVIAGNLTFGDAATDSVSFGAEISSSIIPDSDSAYDIGSAAKNWKRGYVEELSATHVTASGNISGSLTSTGSLGRIEVTTLESSKFGTTAASLISGSLSQTHLSAKVSGIVSGSAQIASDISGSFSQAHLSSKISNIVSGSTQLASDISGSLGANASLIRSLTAVGVSGSLGTNASLIRSLTAVAISGSTNALTVSGSWRGELSSSALTNVGGGVSGSSTSTGSFGGLISSTGEITTVTSTTLKDFTSISGSLASTGSFGRVEASTIEAKRYIISSSVSNITTQEISGSTKFGDSLDDTHQRTGSLYITGSSTISGTMEVVTPVTTSTAITTNNVTNGYPTSNAWGSSLGGSYFNNFDNTTHVSEILRFMSGVLSHSLDVADASPNTKTFASIDTNETNTGTTDTISGYTPTNYTALSNATLNYLVHKRWTSVGATIFNGISVYHDNGPNYYIDFDSNSGGSTNISSSADSELFGLGSLSSGNANTFGVRAIVTQSFSDTGSISAPDESSNKFTTQSSYDKTVTSFGTSAGVTLAKINTSQPAVIPAAYQDGKFTDFGGTSVTGSLTRRYSGSNPGLLNSFTSVSSSGYYRFHGMKVGILSGSESAYTFVNGTTKNRFWAPIDTIDSAIGTNTLSDTGTTHRALTATSRSLSGVPYLIDSTYEVSTKITGLFNPMYAASTTLVNMTAASVGAGSVSISGDVISTSGGTIQTSGKVFQSDGTTGVNSGVPRYNDIAIVTGSVSFDSGNNENINQTGVGDTTFTVATKARNRNSSNSTLDTQTITYHTAGDFSQPAASGSLAIYGRAQGYDGGSLTGTSEAFSGESHRIKLANNVTGFDGTAWTTTYVLGTNIGTYELQVKPGYLVDPGGTYRYWYPNNTHSGATYKYYIRRFQTSGTKTEMTVDIGKTLVNWNATTADSAAVALLLKSAASGSGANSVQSVCRIYDPSDLTSNVIETSVSADNFKNPFTSAINLYGNTGGSKSSTEYTVPIRNADGMYLDSSDNELYVIVRYKGDVTPVTSITLGFS